MFWKKKKTKRDNLDIDKAKSVMPDNGNILMAIVYYLTDGILVFDKGNKLSLINPKAQEILDIENKNIIGTSLLDLCRNSRVQLLTTVFGGGFKETEKKELEISQDFIIEVSSISLVINREKTGTLVILHDITKQKMIERLKSEFVTVAAHQLRTPASAVKWTIKMLLDGDIGELTENQKESLDIAYKTNEKMIRLVNDLLNVAQIEEGKYLSKLVLSDIEEVVYSVIESYKKMIDDKGIKLEFNKPEEKLPKLLLDKEKMAIAVGNLLDNAVRYNKKGGKIIVSFSINDKEVEVKIEDNGFGILENQKDKIFTKFFRGANIVRIETEGTGLGLYISKNIIEAHRGRIWFQSKEKKGSVFCFSIPIKEKFGEFLTGEFY
ncbi:MAG: ATP-binding protein [Candidatus Pacebacteria bacterium]|nr:ATP-binding protein [Candidatus Paceibacterota bacterium]